MRLARKNHCLIPGYPTAHVWPRSSHRVQWAGTTLTIRKFHSRFFTAEELVRAGSLSPALLDSFRNAVVERRNILISGGTSSGKTTLLTALAAYIPDQDRVVLIEDTSEVQMIKPNLVRFEARREQPGVPAVTIWDLLRATLRHRPDRIILGEVRGGEAFDLLQALNTGHSGTLSTVHANSAAQSLSRFTSCVLQSGVELPYQAIRANIADAVQLVIHLEVGTAGALWLRHSGLSVSIRKRIGTSSSR